MYRTIILFTVKIYFYLFVVREYKATDLCIMYLELYISNLFLFMLFLSTRWCDDLYWPMTKCLNKALVFFIDGIMAGYIKFKSRENPSYCNFKAGSLGHPSVRWSKREERFFFTRKYFWNWWRLLSELWCILEFGLMESRIIGTTSLQVWYKKIKMFI